MERIYSVTKRGVFLVFLLGFSFNLNAKKNDMSDWVSTILHFSDHALSFKHPGGFSGDFPDKKPVYETDLYNPAIYNSGHPLIAFKKYWDYKGFFWQVYGTLSMTVLVAKKPDSFNGSILELSNLEMLIDSLLREEFDSFNQGLREQGDPQFIVELPKEYKRAGQRQDWLYYSMGGRSDSHIYAKPLTNDHYLKIVFSFVDNSRNQKYKWRKDAETLTQNIMQTVEIGESKF